MMSLTVYKLAEDYNTCGIVEPEVTVEVCVPEAEI